MNAFEVVGIDKLPHDVDRYAEFAGHEIGVHLPVGVVEWKETDPSFVFDFVASLEIFVWPSNLGRLRNLKPESSAHGQMRSHQRALTFAISA